MQLDSCDPEGLEVVLNVLQQPGSMGNCSLSASFASIASTSSSFSATLDESAHLISQLVEQVADVVEIVEARAPVDHSLKILHPWGNAYSSGSTAASAFAASSDTLHYLTVALNHTCNE
ncbi:MAG: hypothetical protein QXJ38_04300 [Thermofilaceae archaeon]